MNSAEPIGGYFELELPLHQGALERHADAVLLNSGRSAFEYVLRATKPTKVYLPTFTCDVMLEPLKKEGVDYEFYTINDKLEIATDLQLALGEFLVYTNYFGIKSEYAIQLGEKFGDKLIYDCSQAYYADPLPKSHTFYSPRKFFGLPDGGLLHTHQHLTGELPLSESADHSSHLIKRIEYGAEAAYEDFKKNDAALSNQGMQAMSKLTRRLLDSIDVAKAQAIREHNFVILHNALGATNQLPIPDSVSGPHSYPFLATPELRQKLIEQKIFVATYWPNVLDWAKPAELEYRLAQNILPLPIDQRYNDADMERIIRVINE